MASTVTPATAGAVRARPRPHPVQLSRQHHVLHRGEAGDQVEVLEHIADGAAAGRGEGGVAQRSEVGPLPRLRRDRGCRGLEPGQVLESAQRRHTLGLHDVVDVHPGLVTAMASLIASSSRGRSARATGVPNQRRTSSVPSGLNPVDETALIVGAHPDDHAVALKAGQGGVDLSDVERPGGAGGGLELHAQLIAVPRSLGEQGQQAVTDRHTYAAGIPRIPRATSGTRESRRTERGDPSVNAKERAAVRRAPSVTYRFTGPRPMAGLSRSASSSSGGAWRRSARSGRSARPHAA